MITVKDLDAMTCTFIPVDDLRIGHMTVLGEVTEEPEFSPSRKTVVVTVRTHRGTLFTDRRSAAAKIAVFTPKG